MDRGIAVAQPWHRPNRRNAPMPRSRAIDPHGPSAVTRPRRGNRPRWIPRRCVVVAVWLLALTVACSRKTVAPATVPRDLYLPPVAVVHVSGGCTTTLTPLDASASTDPDGVIRL